MDHIVKKPEIIGATTINHAARVAMGLNCSEYVLMNYIYWCAKNNKPLLEMDTYMKTGFEVQESVPILDSLIKKGFVLISTDLSSPQITSKWESAFTNLEDEFENQFWKKDGKVVWLGSSRKQSFIFYDKARKKYPKETLINNRNEYLEYLEAEHSRGFNRQIMGCEKYLNEKNEYYLVDWKTMTNQIKEQLKPKTESAEPKQPLTAEARKKMYE